MYKRQIGKVATNAGIPLVLQEQNSYAGVTNKLLAKKAAKICVAYEGMERFFPQEKIIFTGNPVRKDLLNAVSERAEGIAFYGLNANKKTVLVTGGSLGAGSINKAMVRWLEKIAGWKDVQVIWQCGSYYHKEMCIRDRAIRVALMLAKKGDIVLVAGKGHEDYQEIKGVKHHFDDKEVIKEIFKL